MSGVSVVVMEVWLVVACEMLLVAVLSVSILSWLLSGDCAKPRSSTKEQLATTTPAESASISLSSSSCML